MTVTDSMIETQRGKVFGSHPKVDLVEPCRIGKGIMRLSEAEKFEALRYFELMKIVPQFFIPASGSGSRMFQFLFDFLENPTEENRSQVERFLNHLEDFAFYRKIHCDIRKQLNENRIDLAEFVRYVVSSDGLNLGDLPKGLVPFHNYGYFILNPFQEHVLQAARLGSGIAKMHFTVNLKYSDKIKEAIDQVCAISGYQIETTFSAQNEDTDSIAFTKNGDIFEYAPGQPLTRPSGHGALLDNLQEINAEVVFIKNVDNIQHEHGSGTSINEFKTLGGLLLQLNDDLRKVLADGKLNRELFVEIVNRYQLMIDVDNIQELNENEIIEFVNRPRRVCGMVRNEGQPGGGPFWVKTRDGRVTKQIVEKTQIASNGDQFNIMVKSSHFNPVMIACDMRDLGGNQLNLVDYRDEEMYYIVKKNFKGRDILFAEQPGLWNGGMAEWLTVFVEVSSKAFTPVKTVLDLLENSHQANGI